MGGVVNIENSIYSSYDAFHGTYRVFIFSSLLSRSKKNEIVLNYLGSLNLLPSFSWKASLKNAFLSSLVLFIFLVSVSNSSFPSGLTVRGISSYYLSFLYLSSLTLWSNAYLGEFWPSCSSSKSASSFSRLASELASKQPVLWLSLWVCPDSAPDWIHEAEKES